MKRLLAYSSIAQAGYILTGVIAANTAGLSGSLFYLVAYGFATIGAFAIVTLVRDRGGEAAHMSSWAGLGKRSPLVAGVFALFLIAFAGIPLTSGFTGKFAVFRAAIQGGALPLVDHRRHQQRHPGVPVRAGDRADVLQRARRRGPGRRHGRAPTPAWRSPSEQPRPSCSALSRSRCSTWRTTQPASCSSARQRPRASLCPSHPHILGKAGG